MLCMTQHEVVLRHELFSLEGLDTYHSSQLLRQASSDREQFFWQDYM